jgi:protein-disulfide isomerase
MNFPGSYLAVSALVAAILLVAPVSAPAQSSFTDSEKAEIGEIVRQYLINNPGVLDEVVEALERQQMQAQEAAQQQAVSENRNELFHAPTSFVAGNPEGDVTLVEFFDFNCTYCRQMLSTLVELIESNSDLRVVLKDWPVLGEESVQAARVAVAVKNTAPEGYFEFHRAMMSQRGRLDGNRALEIAEEIGLDRDAIATASTESRVDETLSENAQLGARIGLRGTPSYVLGDEVLAGALRLDAFQQKIAEVRANGCEGC